jgi:hypothetical protein
LEKLKLKGFGGMAQEVESMHRKSEALNSIPSIINLKKAAFSPILANF